MKLRDWLADVEKDERRSVKLLVADFKTQRDELCALLVSDEATP